MVRNLLLGLALLILIAFVGAADAPAAEPAQPVVTGAFPDTLTVVGSTIVPAGSFGLKRVQCPAGTVAIGGGIDPYNVFNMQVTSSAPAFANGDRLLNRDDGLNVAPTAWQASARNETTTDRIIKVAVVCARLDRVVTTVTSATAGVDSFAFKRASCPGGLVATGGGIDPYNIFTMQVTSSGPGFANGDRLLNRDASIHEAPSAWLAGARNETANQQIVKVAAICAPLNYISTVVSSITVPDGAFQFIGVSCPQGSVATGGGIDPYNVYKMQITSTGPGFGDNTRLLLQPDGYGASPVGWLAGARNDTGEDRAFKIGAICARAQLFLPLVRD